MKPLRIAILDLYCNHPNQGMRCIKYLIDEQLFPVTWKVFDVAGKNQLPDLDFDIYISSGGPGDPTRTGEEWIDHFYSLIDKLIEHNSVAVQKKYVFLICHSFQMVCHHLKLAQVCLRKSPAFGIFPVHKTEEGKKEILFQSLPNPFYAVDSRDWQIIEPDVKKLTEQGAKICALEKIRPHVNLERAVMAIRFSPEIFGTQFHPEADVVGMKFYFSQEEKKKQIISNHGEDKYKEMVSGLTNPVRIQLTHQAVLPQFLQSAALKLRGFRKVKTE
ncbi:MAG: GMP synthase [Bacteroidia bacterium]|nr:GMP synthase [Bacteroidia bacterium]MCZ2278013.1 GMP synthase [Bacteroidia bacterium]